MLEGVTIAVNDKMLYSALQLRGHPKLYNIHHLNYTIYITQTIQYTSPKLYNILT